MDAATSERRQAFSVWLRTGRLRAGRSIGGLELKFNPNRDPTNGQFTFGTSGAHNGDQWAKATKSGDSVSVTITPSYAGTSKRPTTINVSYSINGNVERAKFPNERREKPHGKR